MEMASVCGASQMARGSEDVPSSRPEAAYREREGDAACPRVVVVLDVGEAVTAAVDEDDAAEDDDAGVT
jgi:hypothetical protein